MEIIKKEITSPKLTVAIGRVTLKTPVDYPEDQVQRLIKFSERIAAQLKPELVYTFRGRFQPNENGRFEIVMTANSKEKRREFKNVFCE